MKAGWIVGRSVSRSSSLSSLRRRRRRCHCYHCYHCRCRRRRCRCRCRRLRHSFPPSFLRSFLLSFVCCLLTFLRVGGGRCGGRCLLVLTVRGLRLWLRLCFLSSIHRRESISFSRSTPPSVSRFALSEGARWPWQLIVLCPAEHDTVPAPGSSWLGEPGKHWLGRCSGGHAERQRACVRAPCFLQGSCVSALVGVADALRCTFATLERTTLPCCVAGLRSNVLGICCCGLLCTFYL